MINLKRGSNVYVKVEAFLNANTIVADLIELGKTLAESGIPMDSKVRIHRDGSHNTMLVASHSIETPHPLDEER